MKQYKINLLSLVIPIFNEEENVRILYKEIKDALKEININYEIILVDDGSSDDTFTILKEIKATDEKVVIIKLRKNFGQTAAVSAGFDHAKGEVIVTLDGDLQNDPTDIPLLLDKIEEGFDVVSGWRHQRQDSFLSRILPSMLANKLISLTTKIKLHDYGCSLKAFRSEVIKNINLYGEMHRFIPAIASWMGITETEVKVNHRPRVHGKSKYGISRTLRVILDLVTVKFLLTYATKPIHVFGSIGVFSGGLGFFLSLYLAFVRLILKQPIGNRPLLLVAVFMLFIGIQFVTMGLLAEIQIRTYHEAQKKPIYVIKEIV